MAQTFTQKSMQELQLSDFTPEQIMKIALRVSSTLGWVIARKGEASFTAYTNNGIFNWNAEVQFTMNANGAHIVSQSHNIRGIAPGKDRMNINNFISKFNEMKESGAGMLLDSVYLDVQSNVA